MISRRKSGAAIAATILLAGCGGGSSSTVSASNYVKSVCAAVGGFRKDVQNKTASLATAGVTNPAQGKKALQDFLSTAASSSDTVVSKLKDAGTPNVSNGKRISSSIVNAFSQLSSSFKQAKSSANTLQTSSAKAFQTGAQSIQSSIRSSLTGLLSGLSGLNSSELQQAAKQEPACVSLSG